MTLIQLEEELKEARLRGAQDHAAVLLFVVADNEYWHVDHVESKSVKRPRYCGPAVVLS